MLGDPRTTPTNLKAPHGGRVMEITWADGHKSPIPHEVLRGYCPCAHCQGHGGEIKFVPGGDLDLRDIKEVGSYALQFTWGDRHDSGIYTFPYLRSLCQCEACKPTFDPHRAP
jgi:prepilin-type processing-associated H-X9-DG protein